MEIQCNKKLWYLSQFSSLVPSVDDSWWTLLSDSHFKAILLDYCHLCGINSYYELVHVLLRISAKWFSYLSSLGLLKMKEWILNHLPFLLYPKWRWEMVSMNIQSLVVLIVSCLNFWLTEIISCIPCKPEVATQKPYFHHYLNRMFFCSQKEMEQIASWLNKSIVLWETDLRIFSYVILCWLLLFLWNHVCWVNWGWFFNINHHKI